MSVEFQTGEFVYIDFNSSPGSVSQSYGATMSYWFRTTEDIGTNTGYPMWFADDYYGYESDWMEGYQYYDDVGGTVVDADTSVDCGVYSGDVDLNDGEWHHVALEYEVDYDFKLWIDGEQVDVDNTGSLAVNFAIWQVNIGDYNSAYSNYIRIAECAIWDYEIGEVNIRMLANGKPADLVGIDGPDSATLIWYARFWNSWNESSGEGWTTNGTPTIESSDHPVEYVSGITYAESVPVTASAYYNPDEILVIDTPTVDIEVIDIPLSKSESVSVSDTPAVSIPTEALTVTESISVSDSPTAILTLAIFSFEAISVTDTPTVLNFAPLLLSETVSVADTPETYVEEVSLAIPIVSSDFAHWVREIKIYE